MKDARRPLTFTSLNDMMPDVERLLRGHTTVGNWSLGQICSHITQAIHFTIDGFPPEIYPPWLFRITVGRLLLWYILRTGRFTEGLKMVKKYEPRPGSEALVEAASLRSALQRFAAHTGPLARHPISGVAVGRAVWERFHCIHSAHHLRFAIPVDSCGSSTNPAGQ